MEYDISLGSIDAMGGLYDGLLAYATMPDPEAPGVMREDTGVHPDKPHGLALQGRLAESWDVSADGRKATFTLREGVKSNWGNTLSAADVKWTWDRKFHLKGTGAFITKMLGMTSEDQVKVEAPNVISISLEKPSPLLLKIQCNLGSPIYDSAKLKAVGGSDDPWGSAFLKNQSAGFGPYEVAQIVRGQQALFRARPDYWGPKPFMDTVAMREVPKVLPQAAYRCCRAALWTSRSSCSRGAHLAQDFVGRGIRCGHLVLHDLAGSANAKIKPFDNVDVRRAMNLLIRPRSSARSITTLPRGRTRSFRSAIPDAAPSSSTTMRTWTRRSSC